MATTQRVRISGIEDRPDATKDSFFQNGERVHVAQIVNERGLTSYYAQREPVKAHAFNNVRTTDYGTGTIRIEAATPDDMGAGYWDCREKMGIDAVDPISYFVVIYVDMD